MRASETQEELRAAISRLYEAFEPYRLKPAFDERCSPLGTRRALARALAAEPLRSVGVEGLAIYAFKATLTMGDEEDFKHFLPRMLELNALEPEWHHHETNVFSRITELGWRAWPQAEQRAIEAYLLALWHDACFSPAVVPDEQLGSALEALGIDLGPFLAG